MHRSVRRWGFAFAVAAILAVAPAGAVTDEEIFRDFRFNFINPGGRSLGMGGAFVSQADDATAAQANPAGLVRLAKPEFFGEFRFTNFDDSQTTQHIDDGAGRVTDVLAQTSPAADTSPSFLAYAHPAGRLAFGFSRQELISSRSTTRNRFEVVDANSTAPDNTGFLDGTGSITLRVVNYNASLGVSLHERFSLGVTATYAQLNQDSQVSNLFSDLFVDPDVRGNELWRTDASESDTDVTFTLGFLWKVVDRLSIGGVYRQGADFTVPNRLSSTLDPTIYPGFVVDVVFQNACGIPYTTGASCLFDNEFHLPDTYSLGASWRPIDGLTFALDANRIAYSDLLEGFQSRMNVLTFFRPPDNAAFTVDDQTNLHFGAEYVITKKSVPIALRLGWHQDKDGSIRANFDEASGGGFLFSNNDTFPGRGDLNHATAGVGLVFGNNFQLDTAIDYSSDTLEAVASFIHRF